MWSVLQLGREGVGVRRAGAGQEGGLSVGGASQQSSVAYADPTTFNRAWLCCVIRKQFGVSIASGRGQSVMRVLCWGVCTCIWCRLLHASLA
jgi:hypothetical protein